MCRPASFNRIQGRQVQQSFTKNLSGRLISTQLPLPLMVWGPSILPLQQSQYIKWVDYGRSPSLLYEFVWSSLFVSIFHAHPRPSLYITALYRIYSPSMRWMTKDNQIYFSLCDYPPTGMIQVIKKSLNRLWCRIFLTSNLTYNQGRGHRWGDKVHESMQPWTSTDVQWTSSKRVPGRFKDPCKISSSLWRSDGGRLYSPSELCRLPAIMLCR